MANLVLTETISDPDVNYTFVPYSNTDGVASFEAASADGVPVGAARLTASVKRVAQSGKNRVTYKLSLPVVQDVDVGGIVKPQVIRTQYATIELLSDSTSSSDERGIMVQLLRDLLGESITWDVAVGLQPYF
jgi:hypothetical protein